MPKIPVKINFVTKIFADEIFGRTEIFAKKTFDKNRENIV